jgi:hypothetical protein
VGSPKNLNELKLAKLAKIRELVAMQEEARGEVTKKYMYDPVLWVQDFMRLGLGGSLTHYQERILRELAIRRRVAVRGPHGLGKSFSASMAVLWFAMTREAMQVDWKVLITASAWRQISGFLFPEIRRWARAINWEHAGRPPFNERHELLHLGLNLRYGSVITAAASDPAKLEGAHADSVLVVFDEAKAIMPTTWDAIEGAFSGGKSEGFPEAFALALSTPGEVNGRFYEIHSRRPGLEDWHPIHVTLADAIQAGRISPGWAEQRKKQWGESSALYQRRVLGNFHADDEDACIPLAWVEAAVERWHTWSQEGRPVTPGPVWTGVDVGRGGDESVLARLAGGVVTLHTSRVKDTMEIVRLAQVEPGRCAVDVIGVGAGVYDRLKELGKKPMAYAGAGKARSKDRSKEFGFANVRSEAYWRLREALDPEYEPTLCLPPDDLLISDLTTPRWSIAPGVPPKIRIEGKDDVVARLGRSPDRGDAVVMALAGLHSRPPTQVAIPSGTLGAGRLSPLAR